MEIMIVDGDKEETALIGQFVQRLGPSSSFNITSCALENSFTEIQRNGEPDIIILPWRDGGDHALRDLSKQNLKSSVFIYTGKLNGKPVSDSLTYNTKKQATFGKQRFLIKQASRIITIPVDQIAYFYAESRLNYLRTWDNRSLIVDYTMEQLAQQLNPFDFFRVNRSYIVSYKSIREIKPYFNSRIKLYIGDDKTREEILVSREKVGELKEWLGAK